MAATKSFEDGLIEVEKKLEECFTRFIKMEECVTQMHQEFSLWSDKLFKSVEAAEKEKKSKLIQATVKEKKNQEQQVHSYGLQQNRCYKRRIETVVLEEVIRDCVENHYRGNVKHQQYFHQQATISLNKPVSNESDSLLPSDIIDWIIISLGVVNGLIVGIIFGRSRYASDWLIKRFETRKDRWVVTDGVVAMVGWWRGDGRGSGNGGVGVVGWWQGDGGGSGDSGVEGLFG
ncbi:hypothetical protein Tco_0869466 [Tanacetum coccineum]